MASKTDKWKREANFGKNRKIFVCRCNFVCRWDYAKDVIRWQNRKIKIESLAPVLKIYNHVLVGCMFESMRWRFWLIWRRVAWFCPAAFEKYDLHTDCHIGTKIGKLHYFVERQEVHFFCLRDTDLWWIIQHVVPKRQSMFWLLFLFVFWISLKWGQCTVDVSRQDIFRGQIPLEHW